MEMSTLFGVTLTISGLYFLYWMLKIKKIYEEIMKEFRDDSY